MGSVQFQIVPCSCLYFFSRSIGPFQCLVSANYRVLTCCTCHFQSSSLFFVYFGFLCLQAPHCLISTLTWGGEGGHLLRLTCSVVLWGGRETASKYHSCVGSARRVWATLGLPLLTVCVLSQSTLLRLQVALQGAGPELRALPRSKPLKFRFSGTPQRRRLSWVCILCPSQIRAAQATRCLASVLSQVGILITSPVWAAQFLGCAPRVPSQVCHVSPLGS